MPKDPKLNHKWFHIKSYKWNAKHCIFQQPKFKIYDDYDILANFLLSGRNLELYTYSHNNKISETIDIDVNSKEVIKHPFFDMYKLDINKAKYLMTIKNHFFHSYNPYNKFIKSVGHCFIFKNYNNKLSVINIFENIITSNKGVNAEEYFLGKNIDDLIVDRGLKLLE